jgi:septal ring factor EnvC (AmiA/AmiB activator)
MKPRCVPLILFLAVAGVASVSAEPPLQETRSTLEKWVETRGLVSKTRSDWQSDKEMLEQSIQLLERELKAVEDQMAKVSTNSTQAEKERTQTEESLKAANDSLEQTKQFATSFEAKILKLVPQLPLSLQDMIKTLINRIPTDPTNTKAMATERIQVIVGILNELDKFNNAVSVFSEKRKTANGEEIACETLYVGLGAAYFVNDKGDFAGMGTPGPTGWVWTPKPEIASPVRELVRIYRNERPARFIPLPAVIR